MGGGGMGPENMGKLSQIVPFSPIFLLFPINFTHYFIHFPKCTVGDFSQFPILPPFPPFPLISPHFPHFYIFPIFPSPCGWVAKSAAASAVACCETRQPEVQAESRRGRKPRP